MLTEEPSEGDLTIECLFDDQLVIAAGAQSKWTARRRKIDLADLIDEPWILQAPHSWNHRILTEACRVRGLPMPKASLVTLSMSVITHFLADGPFITAMPRSVAYFKSLKVLPVGLPVRPWPVNIVTLKNRTLSPVVERFIGCAREVSKVLEKERHRNVSRPQSSIEVHTRHRKGDMGKKSALRKKVRESVGNRQSGR